MSLMDKFAEAALVEVENVKSPIGLLEENKARCESIATRCNIMLTFGRVRTALVALRGDGESYNFTFDVNVPGERFQMNFTSQTSDAEIVDSIVDTARERAPYGKLRKAAVELGEAVNQVAIHPEAKLLTGKNAIISINGEKLGGFSSFEDAVPTYQPFEVAQKVDFHEVAKKRLEEDFAKGYGLALRDGVLGVTSKTAERMAKDVLRELERLGANYGFDVDAAKVHVESDGATMKVTFPLRFISIDFQVSPEQYPDIDPDPNPLEGDYQDSTEPFEKVGEDASYRYYATAVKADPNEVGPTIEIPIPAPGGLDALLKKHLPGK